MQIFITERFFLSQNARYDIEFKDDMPKTLVGMVACSFLEEEELAKLCTAKKIPAASENEEAATVQRSG